MNREEAWALLNEYNKDPFHLEHGEIVGKTMRYFAEKLGYGDEADFWEVVGILHDLDFEQYPDQHQKSGNYERTRDRPADHSCNGQPWICDYRGYSAGA